MKIQVVRCDGNAETLELVGTVRVVEPCVGGQGVLETEAGDHYFRASDGRYDGWGMAVSGIDENRLGSLIDAVEHARVVDKPEGTA